MWAYVDKFFTLKAEKKRKFENLNNSEALAIQLERQQVSPFNTSFLTAIMITVTMINTVINIQNIELNFLKMLLFMQVTAVTA